MAGCDLLPPEILLQPARFLPGFLALRRQYMASDEVISRMYREILRDLSIPHLKIQKISEEILSFLIEIFGADKAELAVIRDDFDPLNMELTDANAFKCRIIRGYSDEEWQHLKEAGVLDKSLRYCLTEKDSVVVPDTDLEPPEERDLSKYLGTGSWMNNVLLLEDRVIAKIHLSKKEKFHYNERSLEELKQFSLLLSTAINVSGLWERERKLIIDFIGSLNRAIELKDKYTAGHMERVKLYSVGLAKTLNLSQHEIEVIEIAAILHDIGKIGISDDILKKPGKLDEEEFEMIKQHVPLADHILKNIHYLDEARKVAVLHHEHFDGSGYVMGVVGEDLPIGSRIIGIVDAFDAMTSDRPYRSAYYVEEVIEILETPDLRHWDSRIIKVFIDYLHTREFYESAVNAGLIRLKDDEYGSYDREQSLLLFRNIARFFGKTGNPSVLDIRQVG